MNQKTLILILAIIGGILLIPFIAMRYSDAVDWTWGDFIIAAILLFEVAIMVYYINKRAKKTGMRLLFYIVLALILILVWAELAVGVF